MSESSAVQIRVEVLAQVATALASANDVTAVSQALIDVLCPLFADGCEVALKGQDGTIWRVASGPGDMSARVRARVPDLEDHPLRRATAGEFLVIDVEDDPQAASVRAGDRPVERPFARDCGRRSSRR